MPEFSNLPMEEDPGRELNIPWRQKPNPFSSYKDFIPRTDQPLAQGLPAAVFDPAMRYLDYLAGGAANRHWRFELANACYVGTCRCRRGSGRGPHAWP